MPIMPGTIRLLQTFQMLHGLLHHIIG